MWRPSPSVTAEPDAGRTVSFALAYQRSVEFPHFQKRVSKGAMVARVPVVAGMAMLASFLAMTAVTPAHADLCTGKWPPKPPAASAPVQPSADQPLFPVQVGDTYGYMDKSGILVLKPRFEVADIFYDGLALVYLPGQGGSQAISDKSQAFHVDRGFIDRTGRLKFKVNFPQNAAYDRAFASSTIVCPFSDGRALVEIRAPDLTSKMGYIESSGRLVIPATFDLAATFTEGLARVARNGTDYVMRWGFIDPTGTYAIPSQYADAESFAEGVAAIQDPSSELWGFINNHGDYVLTPQFKRAWNFSEGYAVVETPNGRTLIDKAGAFHGGPAPAVQALSEGLSAFNTGGRGDTWLGGPTSDAATGGQWGYRDADGNVVIAAQFAAAKPFSEGFAAVNMGGMAHDNVVEGGRWGYIDKSGHWRVTPQFGEANGFSDGLASVETAGTGFLGMGGRAFYINTSGNEVKARSPNDPPPPRASPSAVDPERLAREANERGKQAIELRDLDGAIASFTEAIQANPQFYQAYYNRAGIYSGVFGGDRNCDLAIQDLTRAIEIKPDLYQAYNNRGLCYMARKQYEAALADFTKALRLNRTLSRAHVELAEALANLGRYQEAWTEVTAATEVGENVPQRVIDFLNQHTQGGSLNVADRVQVTDQLASDRPTDLATTHKTTGLFVGVSNYPPQSGVQSTPAHTIGATIFHEIFYRAEAKRQGLSIEKSGLGNFISEYKPAPDEYLFEYNGHRYVEMIGASFGRQPQPDIPNLSLIADLRMDPRDDTVKPAGVVRLLASVDGSWLQLRDHSHAPVALSPPGVLWPYFGRGRWIDRTTLLGALDAALQRAVGDMSDTTEFFVVYIAAHGRLDEHGSPYLITANDQLAGPEKLYYSEVLEHIAHGGTAPAGKQLIKLVIFDACEEADPVAVALARQSPADLALPPNTLMVTSTSPGHYAWHLPSSIVERHSVEVSQGGAGKAHQAHVFNEAFSSTSSAFPIAADIALRDTRSSQTITLEQWLTGIEAALPKVVPAGELQTMTHRPTTAPDASTAIFKVVLASKGNP